LLKLLGEKTSHERGEKMKWEYKILIVRDQIDPNTMVAELANMGTEDWEAVAMTPKYGVPAYIVLLKRPLQK